MLTSIPLTILLIFINQCQGYLIDRPIKSPKGSVSIFASLTDQLTQESWIVKETLSVSPQVHGEIEITKGNDRIQVFYNENNDATRLVIHDNLCSQMQFTSNGWNSMLPSVSKPLLNMALLMGPSLVYRFNDQIDENLIPEDNVEIRGETMKSYAVRVGYDLRVSFIFPDVDGVDVWDAIEEPKRLLLDGWSPDFFKVFDIQETPKETLFYDIYSIKVIDDAEGQFESILGFGCPGYLTTNQPFPGLTNKEFHLQVIETISTTSSESTLSRLEFDVDARNKITRVKSFDNDVMQESIINHYLGIKYEINSDGKCLIKPIVDQEDDYLTVNQITWMEGSFEYVGKVKYNHRSELVHVWEATEYNKSVKNNFYNKIVTTQLVANQTNYSSAANYYVPIAAERKFYKFTLDNYVLTESRKRDFFDYTNNYGETEYRQNFQLNDCYDDRYEKMYLTFQITSSDLYFAQSINYAAENINQLRETIKRIIAANLNVSYLRITSIDFEFEVIYILAHVEIIEAPDLIGSLEQEEAKYDLLSFSGYNVLSTKDPRICLKVHASISDITHIISCMGLQNLCVGIHKNESMPKESSSGSYCLVYNNPFGTLKKLTKEASLNDLSSRYLSTIGIEFNLNCLNCTKSSKYGYSFVNAYQDSASIETQTQRLLFSDAENGFKLKNGQAVVNVKNFGDCYRSCAHSESFPCETFSFCVSGDVNKCLLTDVVYGASKELTTIDATCSVYSKNRLLDFHKVSSVKFIKPSSVTFTIRSIEECARLCSDSDDCHAFEICDYLHCSFGGQFTRQNTLSSTNCDIYIPQTIQNYFKNSHQIIFEVFHIEVDLTLEQCAAICDDWKSINGANDHTDCKSFNYCPKGEATSSCQLTGYSISSGMKTIGVSSSDDCSNYEFYHDGSIVSPAQSLEEPLAKNFSGLGFNAAAVFGILGLITGIIIPFVGRKLRRRPSSDHLSIAEEEFTDAEDFEDTTRI